MFFETNLFRNNRLKRNVLKDITAIMVAFIYYWWVRGYVPGLE